MKIAFLGLPLAALCLARQGHEAALIGLSPVDAPGRRRLGRVLPHAPIFDALFDSGAERGFEAGLLSDPPELLVSWYWTRRIPEHWLSAARLGGIGAHPSLLPRHRGPNPFFWAIDDGDQHTGVSVHRLTPRYDEGAVLASRVIEVGERSAWQLARALDRPSLELLCRVVGELADGRTPGGSEQDESLASWAPEPEGELLRVDWSWSTERVLRRVRALSPAPGLALSLCGLDIFLTKAERAGVPEAARALRPGEAACVGPRVLLRTGDGAIALLHATVGPDAQLTEGAELDESALAGWVRARRGSFE